MDTPQQRQDTGHDEQRPSGHAWRTICYDVIFRADTRAGKLFDVALIAAILLSVVVVMLHSVKDYDLRYGRQINAGERFFTFLFSIEYVLRLSCVRRPWRYALSFFGIVDLLAILPGYLDLVVPGSQGQYLSVIRVLRVLRIFRVLGLAAYMGEARTLVTALKASRHKIIVFLVAVLTLTVILGSAMFVIESRHPQGRLQFSSIPRSVYWAIVTLTTVGYGDISPHTATGQTVAALIMILGYSIIVIPTGLVSVELTRSRPPLPDRSCPGCGHTAHDADARFCKYCGTGL